MPEISRFFGLVVHMYYDDHEPPHVHVEYQGHKVKLDFQGNVHLALLDLLRDPDRIRSEITER